jgi:hypothetical protein
MVYSIHPAPMTHTDHAAIAASLGADLAAVVPDRHGKTVLTVTWPDGCTSLVLVMNYGNGTVRAWPEVDLGAIEFDAAFERHGHYWFVDPADLSDGPGCAQHVSAHWRAQHEQVAPLVAA